jgi:hypothetical protein
MMRAQQCHARLLAHAKQPPARALRRETGET